MHIDWVYLFSVCSKLAPFIALFISGCAFKRAGTAIKSAHNKYRYRWEITGNDKFEAGIVNRSMFDAKKVLIKAYSGDEVVFSGRCKVIKADGTFFFSVKHLVDEQAWKTSQHVRVPLLVNIAWRNPMRITNNEFLEETEISWRDMSSSSD